MPGTKILQLLNGLNAAVTNNAVTIVGAKEQVAANRGVKIGPGWKVELYAMPVGPMSQPLLTLAQQEILHFINFIAAITYPTSTYANVTSNQTWRTLYQYGMRSLKYVNGTAEVSSHPEASLPCLYCGIVLPERLITIDHQRPQTGGEIEAVAKILRTYGLTLVGPKGHKGQAFQTGNVAPIPTKPGRGPKGNDLSLADRYTLNDRGIAFYSLTAAAQALPELKLRCMHSILNLAPLCVTCNSSKGNLLKL